MNWYNTIKIPNIKTIIVGALLFCSQELYANLFQSQSPKPSNTISHSDSLHINPVDMQKAIDSLDISQRFRPIVEDPRHIHRSHEIFTTIFFHEIDSLISEELYQEIVNALSNNKNLPIDHHSEQVLRSKLKELYNFILREKISDIISQYIIHNCASYTQSTWEFYVFDYRSPDLQESLPEENKLDQINACMNYILSRSEYKETIWNYWPSTSERLLSLFITNYLEFSLQNGVKKNTILKFLEYYKSLTAIDSYSIFQNELLLFIDNKVSKIRNTLFNDLSNAIEKGEITSEATKNDFIQSRFRIHEDEINWIQDLCAVHNLQLSIKNKLLE